MDRTAQLLGKYQSACKSHGSTCTCRGTRQDAGCCCSANCTGPAAVYTWLPLEPRPVMPRRRPWQKYRKPTGVISFVVPHPKSRGCHLVHRTRRRTTKTLPRADPKLDRIELPRLWRCNNGSPSQSLKQVAFGPRPRSAGRYEKRAVILSSPQSI